MVLAISIILVFQVLAEFNRPHLPPPDTKREDEEVEGGTSNDKPTPLLGNYNIHIAWEVLHRLLGAELMACYFCQIDAGLILYDRQYLEYDALSLDRKIL